MSRDYGSFLNALGSMVHELRVENGFTQKELAKKARRSQSSIARVEGDPPDEISLKVFFEIADGLSMNLSDLVRLAEIQSNILKKNSSKESTEVLNKLKTLVESLEGM